MPVKLTEAMRRILGSGAGDPRGVVRQHCVHGFDRINEQRRIDKLVTLGLLTPNAHGDHYITPAGRAALDQGGKDAQEDMG